MADLPRSTSVSDQVWPPEPTYQAETHFSSHRQPGPAPSTDFVQTHVSGREAGPIAMGTERSPSQVSVYTQHTPMWDSRTSLSTHTSYSIQIAPPNQPAVRTRPRRHRHNSRCRCNRCCCCLFICAAGVGAVAAITITGRQHNGHWASVIGECWWDWLGVELNW